MICDEEIAMEAIAPIEAILGEGSVVVAYGMIPFHGEDFALFLEKIPGAMFYLGGSNTPEGKIAAPHNPNFCVDEEALSFGVKGMTSLIIHTENYQRAFRSKSTLAKTRLLTLPPSSRNWMLRWAGSLSVGASRSTR